MKKQVLIYGKKVINELLNRHPNLFISVIFNREKIEPAVFSKVQRQKINYLLKERKDLDNLVEGVNHQNIIAYVKEFQYLNFKQWLNKIENKSRIVIAILDEVNDPHNFGAVIRSARAFNVDAIIIKKRNQMRVNSTIFKTSAGLVFDQDIILVSNLNDTILKLQKKGFWVYAFDMSSKEENIIWNQDFSDKSVFIFGNEGSGISHKILEKADFISSIPINPKVESLNISNTSAIAFYEWEKKNKLCR